MIRRHYIKKTRFLVALSTIIVTSLFFMLLTSSVNGQLSKYIPRFEKEFSYFIFRVSHKPVVAEISTENINADSIPVLVYHGIVENPDRFSLTPDRFFEHMASLKKSGYQTITPKDFVEFMDGKKDLPDKSFLLTFDDGRKDSYYGSDFVLRFFGFKAVMFVASHQSIESEKGNYYLDSSELVDMENSGRWFVESHAQQEQGGFISIDKKDNKGNFLSNKMWILENNRLETNKEYTSRLERELSLSKEVIQKLLNKEVTLLSYPFGDFGQQTKNFPESKNIINSLVKKIYKATFFQVWPADDNYLNNYKGKNKILFHRLEPPPNISGEELVKNLNNGRTKELPYTDIFNENNGWKQSWGNVTVKDKILTVSSAEDTTGAFTYIDGTLPWKNYISIFSGKVSPSVDTSVIARFNNTENYIGCFYSKDRINVAQYKNGKRVVLETSGLISFDYESVDLGIGVLDNTVSCIVNGNLIIDSFEVEDMGMPTTGGVGVSVWSKDGQSEAVFEKNVTLPVDKVSWEDVIKSLPKKEIKQIESYVTENSNLPIKYPEYLESEKQSSLLKSIKKYNPNFIFKSDNLLSNFVVTSPDQLNKKQSFWITNKYSLIDSSHNILSNNPAALQVSVKGTPAEDAHSGWYFKPINTTESKEFFVSTQYKSTTPFEIVAQYKMEDGSYKHDRLNWFVPMETWTEASGTFRIPQKTVSLTVLFLIKTQGELSIKDMSLKELEIGNFEEGMITLNFDDGYSTSYTELQPLLLKYKINATHFVVTDYLGYQRYLDIDQLKKISKNKDEIQSHTKTHARLTSLSLPLMAEEILGAKKKLKSLGFNTTVFNYPYGSVNNLVRAETINATYIGARSTLRGFNTKNTDPYMLRDQYVESNVSLGTLKDYIDYAVKSKTWLILEFHDIDDDGGGSLDKKALEEILSYIKLKKIKVINMNDGIGYILK